MKAHIGKPCAHCNQTLTTYDCVKWAKVGGVSVPVHQKCAVHIKAS